MVHMLDRRKRLSRPVTGIDGAFGTPACGRERTRIAAHTASEGGGRRLSQKRRASRRELTAQWMPLVLGLFLGVPVVAREIEARTAPVAWALDPGRGRWLVQRVLPVLLVAVIFGLLIGIGGELLTAVSAFGEHPLGTGFVDDGSRLGQVPVRTLGVFVLAGALTVGMDAWMHAAAVPIPYDQGYEAGSRLFSQWFRDDVTGALSDTNAFDAQNFDPNSPGPTSPPGKTRVWLGIPGDQYNLWVAREAGVVLAASLLVATGTVLIIRRRRPE